MVLRILLGLSFSFNAWASDPQAFAKASELAQKGRKESALRILETNFNLHSRELPVKVATLATSLLVAMRRWHKAEQVGESALNANWPGWNTKRPSKSQAEFMALLKAVAQSKTEILELGAAGRDAAKLKAEIQTCSEILGVDSEESKAYAARIEHHTQAEKASDYHYAVALLLSYWTWEDRPSFDYQRAGKSKIFSPCFGLSVDYTNDLVHWAAGACAGAGSASLEFNNTTAGYFDNRAKVTLIAGYGSVLMRLSALGAAFGIEGDVMNASISGKQADGTTLSATNQSFAVTAVGRYRIGSFDFKFKGGPVISTPSALWSFELGYIF